MHDAGYEGVPPALYPLLVEGDESDEPRDLCINNSSWQVSLSMIDGGPSYLQEVDGGDGNGTADAEVLEGGQDGDGAYAEGGHVSQGGHGDGDTRPRHRERHVLDEAVALPLLLGDVLEAPQDDEHVVDADSQGQEGQHAMNGCVPEAKASRQPKRYDDAKTDVLGCF